MLSNGKYLAATFLIFLSACDEYGNPHPDLITTIGVAAAIGEGTGKLETGATQRYTSQVYANAATETPTPSGSQTTTSSQIVQGISRGDTSIPTDQSRCLTFGYETHRAVPGSRNLMAYNSCSFAVDLFICYPQSKNCEELFGILWNKRLDFELLGPRNIPANGKSFVSDPLPGWRWVALRAGEVP